MRNNHQMDSSASDESYFCKGENNGLRNKDYYYKEH